MTALDKYQRLEATGLWRPSPDDQRREVIVSLGNASLTMTDTNDRALAHWSVAAVARANKGQDPAIFHPDGDPGETLELSDDAAEMIAAIDTIRTAIERSRPHERRLRGWLTGTVVAGLVAATIFWLPDALIRHTMTVVPQSKRDEIGAALLARISRVAGRPCAAGPARPALRQLAERLMGDGASTALVVLPSGVAKAAHLPGGLVLLNRSLIEDFEDVDVPAGYILAEATRMQAADPLGELLEHAGLFASARLLTSGNMPEAALDRYTEALLVRVYTVPDPALLLPAFEAAGLRSSAYAFAEDITGETTLPLIEADPYPEESPAPILSDADWVRLQGICSV